MHLEFAKPTTTTHLRNASVTTEHHPVPEHHLNLSNTHGGHTFGMLTGCVLGDPLGEETTRSALPDILAMVKDVAAIRLEQGLLINSTRPSYILDNNNHPIWTILPPRVIIFPSLHPRRS